MNANPAPADGRWAAHVLDALAEGVLLLSADGRVSQANPAAGELLGVACEALRGMTPPDPRWQAVREDGSPWPGAAFPTAVALRTGRAQRHQIIGVTLPGRGRRWLSGHAMPVRADPGGPVVQVVTSFVDVTDQVEQRQLLQSTTAALADLYDRAPCGYHSIDAAGRYLRVNDTELAWLGCERQDLVGHRSPMDFMSRPDAATLAAHFTRVRAGERLDGLEVELVGRQGQTRQVRLSVDPILDPAGRFVATRSVMHDISEIVAQRQAWARLTAEQTAILDNELVGIVKLKGRTVIWNNRAFDLILGYAPHELTGRDTATLYPDQAAFERLGAQAYPVLQRGGVFRCAVELRRKDGQPVWTDCSGFMLHPDSDEVIWFSKDITDQRRAEALRLLTVRLEAENQQLQAVSRMHRGFLSNMSHELRTPLNAILGFAQILKSPGAPPGSARQQEFLDIIVGSGQRLLAMIETLLDTARTEQGSLAFVPTGIDPAALAAEAVALQADAAARRQVRLRTQVDPALDGLRLDALRLRQVLQHYLGNAIKFSHEGGEVVLRLLADGPAHWQIEVEDQGIGIREADLATVFEPFHQLSSGSTKRYEGTGIGLALTRRLVEAQGGRVGVRSVLGQGSVFSARLPRVVPAAPATP